MLWYSFASASKFNTREYFCLAAFRATLYMPWLVSTFGYSQQLMCLYHHWWCWCCFCCCYCSS